MCPSAALMAHALSGVEAKRIPSTMRTAPTMRLDLPPDSFNSPVPKPPTMVGGAAAPPKPKRPPAAAGNPAVILVLHASVRCLTLD
jgi:hypothetical protein